MTTADRRRGRTITTRGTIRLGRRLRLEGDEPTFGGARLPPITVPNSNLAGWEPVLRRPPTGGKIQVEPVQPRLTPTGELVGLTDDGLTLQYAVLGRPQSGKTNLLLNMLKEIVFLNGANGATKYGGLILDPKASLIAEVKLIFERYGRRDDLIVLNSAEMRAENRSLNVIGSELSPIDVAEQLKAVTESAGDQASDPFWINQGTRLFAAAYTLVRYIETGTPTLERLARLVTRPPTRGSQLDALLSMGEDKIAAGRAGETRTGRDGTDPVPLDQPDASRLRDAIDDVQSFLQLKPSDQAVVVSVLDRMWALFRDPDHLCYSDHRQTTSIYSQVIDDGKFVLVSVPAGEARLAGILPVLVKWFFQRAVINRFAVDDEGRPVHPSDRPLLFLSDEYHMAASQLDGGWGDADFFSMSRQFGGLSVVATQSIQQLAGALGDRWEEVAGVLGGMIFMQQNDPETCDYARRRSGQGQHWVRRTSTSWSSDGSQTSEVYELLEESELPVGVVDRLFTQGQAVLIGSTGGASERSGLTFFSVPRFGFGADDGWEQEPCR